MSESDRITLLNLPPASVFKGDARSRVWRVEVPESWQQATGWPPQVVIKRYTHAWWRQSAAWSVGAHPVQRESRRATALVHAGVKVLPVLATGWQPRGEQPAGGWLATPLRGRSLNDVLRNQAAGHRERDVVTAVVTLVGELLSADWAFRDLKTGNIVLDEAGTAWLIDTGSAQPDPTGRRRARTLAILDLTLAKAGVSPSTRARGLLMLTQRFPKLGWPHPLAVAVSRERQRLR